METSDRNPLRRGAPTIQPTRRDTAITPDITLGCNQTAVRSLDGGMTREWLVTNGLGGYASGTVAGVNTRRYHGILVAALRPPVERTLMLAKVDERLEVGNEVVALSTNEWHDGTIAPDGYQQIHDFHLELGLPVWTYRLPGGMLEKRVWMPRHKNCTCLSYTLVEGNQPATLHLLCLATYRDYHAETHGSSDWRLDVTRRDNGCRVVAFPGAHPFLLTCAPGATFTIIGDWYWRFLHREERARGLNDLEDLYAVGECTVQLQPGATVTLVAEVETSQPTLQRPEASLKWEQARRRALLARNTVAVDSPTGDLTRHLLLAADQFLVRRQPLNPHDGAGTTVIAGYHWFSDWGRDTMIALPGLCLPTGRAAEAASILRTFGHYLDQGMLPNRFPDAGETPDYNTVDATLWYFNAIDAYTRATGKQHLVRELFPRLQDVISWHERGTRYGIGRDATDGLLKAGEPGVQLTWMDAKVGDWVVTPRTGKPVEINALWYNALRCMACWADELGVANGYRDQAERVRQSFNNRFWARDLGYLYDVVDSDHGDDRSLRPNQLFAISLPYPVLNEEHWQAVVDAVTRHLLVPIGVRTLAPGSPQYAAHYAGDQWHRDSSYHQGTAWAWLLGAYVDAWRRAYPDQEGPHGIVKAMLQHLGDAGIGSISEIFDADAPYSPNGCIAQAWSVAEVLRVLSA